MIKEFTADTWDRERWPNFSFAEIACRETNHCLIDVAFMDRVQRLRSGCGFAITITSGYRSPEHSVEAAKEARGSHTYGVAVDIAVSGAKAHIVLSEAMILNFTGIGISQKGPLKSRFIHLDMMRSDISARFPRPSVWSY